MPSCLRVTVKESKERNGQKPVTILGFANTFGALYLIFSAILTIIAILSFLGVVDSIRDLKGLKKAMDCAAPSVIFGVQMSFNASVSFSEIVPLAILAIQDRRSNIPFHLRYLSSTPGDRNLCWVSRVF